MLFLPALLTGLVSDPAPSQLNDLPIPAACTQAILVTTPSWTSSDGTMRLYERDAAGWKRVQFVSRVRVGRNGMAWGEPRAGAPAKREGDGKAPAGVFDLPIAFGKGPLSVPTVRYPYRPADERDYWVDGVADREYNTWQRIDAGPNDPKLRWTSVERMLLEPYYDLGLVVAYNTDPVVKGRGSAIFMHLWKNPNEATAGCTSMSRETMVALLQWLDPTRRPMLVQMPLAQLPASVKRPR